MIQSFDVGSMPFSGDLKRFMQGSADLTSRSTGTESAAEYFMKKVTESFVDKASTGLDLPNYPQFRDMNEMFLEMMNGVNKTKDGYLLVDESISLKPDKARLPEIEALRRRAKEVYESVGSELRLKICVTGPYTLSGSFIQPETELFEQIEKVLGVVVNENILKEKHIQVSLLSLDEPSFGVIDDPNLDYGSEGRERLLKAWEGVLSKAKSRDVETCIHLHSTRNELFWNVRSLDVVETHVEDPFYSSNRAKKHLEETDKFVKASICLTGFDDLIKRKIEETQAGDRVSETIEQRIADTWKEIRKNRVNPTDFLEEASVLEKRLTKIVDLFGMERVKYAGPECGLGSFPTYDSAVEYLKRVSKTVREVNRGLA